MLFPYGIPILCMKDIAALESVQRFATKVGTKVWEDVDYAMIIDSRVTHSTIYAMMNGSACSGAYERREGASNYHTLVGPILCRIWRLQNAPYRAIAMTS